MKRIVTKKYAQIIPDDGYADGGEPYTDEEMDLMQPDDRVQDDPRQQNKITWNTDVDAPCIGEIIASDGKTTRLVQSDWDYPGVASTFGWTIQNVQKDDDPTYNFCEHSGTDGTVDCKECGITASEFITSAGNWLSDNDGVTAEDPGYFGE